ncbi:MAG: DNA cytosine methyltransferase [Sphingomonas sp.]|nr:DNA cytosine methyltransferase [Sphingomonas sp.]
MSKPLAVDLFCGLGGWTEGLLAEGYHVIGYDIERHEYGENRYPGELVVADVLTLHGSQFKDAALIVASPPCQEYSYMAMPWKKAKAKAAAIRADTSGAELERLNRLFNACFRIQKEASIAAGRHVPLIVENVRGAIPWVGRSRWNFGSFHLWGDVPALMPVAFKAQKVPGFRFDGSGGSFQTASVAETGVKAPGMNWSDPTKRGQDFTRLAGKHAVDHASGTKIGGDWFSDPNSTCRKHGSKSPQRKAASAMIAKIPEPLARHIAVTFRLDAQSRPAA